MSRKLGIVPVPNSRSRQEALERRREASLVLEMARLLLKGENLAQVLPTAAARMAQALELQSAAIVMEAVEPDPRSVAFPLARGRPPPRHGGGGGRQLRAQPLPPAGARGAGA